MLVRAPFAGQVVPLDAVPDAVFADGMMGPGLALQPDDVGAVVVVAPCAGVVAKVHPHAVVVASGERAVLVHLGLDTVELRGAGFTVHVADGDPVAAGDPVLTWNPSAVRAGGRSATSPVVAMQADPAALTWRARPGDRVGTGAELFDWAAPQP